MSRPRLFLHEELMLLALKDREGTVISGTTYTYALGGAVLAELLMAGRVKVGEGKKPRVEVLDATPPGDPLLDEWLESMAGAKKPRTPSDWVGRIAGTKDLKHRVATGLCRRGILRAKEEEVLWIFTRKVYPELDPGPEREIVQRLESALFEEGEVDPRTAVLVAVAQAGGILTALYGRKRMKDRKDRLRQITEGEVSGKATREAVEAMQAAVLVATIVPSVVAATVVTN